jgi:hypothetical protein
LDRTEALQLLRLEPHADGGAINAAYWANVRRAQARTTRDPDAVRDIDRLNEARDVLAPSGRAMPPQAQQYYRRAPADAQPADLPDALLSWFGREAARTRARWEHRNPEIAMIGGGLLILIVFALSAGASALAVIVAAGVVCTAIWAPWRRAAPHPPRHGESSTTPSPRGGEGEHREHEATPAHG